MEHCATKAVEIVPVFTVPNRVCFWIAYRARRVYGATVPSTDMQHQQIGDSNALGYFFKLWIRRQYRVIKCYTCGVLARSYRLMVRIPTVAQYTVCRCVRHYTQQSCKRRVERLYVYSLEGFSMVPLAPMDCSWLLVLCDRPRLCVWQGPLCHKKRYCRAHPCPEWQCEIERRLP